MSNNDLVLPNVDTQKISWCLWGMCKDNRKDYLKTWKSKNWSNSGIYGLYHSRAGRQTCLYIGASINLKLRVSRFFIKQGYVENPYLHWIMSGIIQEQNIRTIKVSFFRTDDIKNLGIYEKLFVEKYKPILNLTKNYHKLHPRREYES